MRKLLVLPCLSLFVLVACSDSSTDPEPPQGIDVSGTWSFSAPSISNGEDSCSFTDVTLELEQSGSTFTGSASGGTFECTREIFAENDLLEVTDGQVSEGTVSFDFGTPNFQNTGTVSGSSMSGTTTIRFSAENLVLTGPFTATRQ